MQSTLLTTAQSLAHEPGTILLLSRGSYSTSGLSFLNIRPVEKIWIDLSRNIFVHERKGERTITPLTRNPWDYLQDALQLSGGTSSPEWFGYLGYEMGAFADRDRRTPFLPPSYPSAYFQRGETLSGYAHDTILPKMRKVGRLTKPLEQMSSYTDKVSLAKELILNGEFYQLNLSHECVYEGIDDPYALFLALAARNPVPFSAYLHIDEKFSILSLSPERFLKNSSGVLEARPIKGTVERRSVPEEDALQKQRLLSSKKENAELFMITDLMRNDLGKISQIGSVEALQLCTCEAYENVYHLNSVVQSKVLPGMHPIDQVRACFPGGSISGCPKLRAMEAIFSLEQRPRGIYTGAIGYIAGDGSFDFNVAIRTLAVQSGAATLSLGGGIVVDSDPQMEYHETLHKGRPFFDVLGFPHVQ